MGRRKKVEPVEPAEQKNMKAADVLRLTGLTRPTLYRWMRKGHFPRSFKLGGSAAVAWDATEVHDWLANCREKRYDYNQEER